MSGFFHALKWSVAGEFVSRIAQPLIFIILARLLTPDDYGVVAAAVMVISFTQIFWDAGMNKALIQRQSHIKESADVAFWINLSLAFFISIALFLFSNLLADKLFKDERVANVLRIMIVQVILTALASVPTALLQKEMKFNRLFWVRMVTVALPGFFSLPLALYGFSYWSLVIGTLIGQSAQVIILWKTCSWRPSLTFNKPIAKELWRFGIWVSINGMLAWFFLWADSFVVGAYFGTHELGLFRTGNTFVFMIFEMLFAPLLPVIYSHFSSFSHEAERIKEASIISIRVITLVAIPLAFLLFTLAAPVSLVVFGLKWQGIAFIIAYLGLMRGYGWTTGINGEIYRAMAKPHLETIVYAISCAFYMIGYLIAIQMGMKVFIYVRLCLGMASLIPHFYILQKLLKISLQPIIKTALISTFAGLTPVILNQIIPVSQIPLLHIIIVSIPSILIMGLMIFLTERNFILKSITEFLSRRRAARVDG